MEKLILSYKITINSIVKWRIKLAFLFILIMFIATIIFSKMQIQIENFRFDSKFSEHINKDFKIVIKLYILKIIPILKINITKAKLEKIKNQDLKFLEKNISLDKEILKSIKRLKFSIKKLNLCINIGTQDAGITAIIVPIISTIISMLIRSKIKNNEKSRFEIKPIYQNKNLLNIYFSGIFEIKIRHIINVIYILSKKGVKEYERTSNRRPYDYSYE